MNRNFNTQPASRHGGAKQAGGTVRSIGGNVIRGTRAILRSKSASGRAVQAVAAAAVASLGIYAIASGTGPTTPAAKVSGGNELPSIDIGADRSSQSLGSIEGATTTLVDSAYDEILANLPPAIQPRPDDMVAPASALDDGTSGVRGIVSAVENGVGDWFSFDNPFVSETPEADDTASEEVTQKDESPAATDESPLQALPSAPTLSDPQAAAEADQEAGADNTQVTEAPAVLPDLVSGAATVRLTVNDSRVIETSRPYTRVAIADDGLATIRPLSPTKLLVTAQKSGTSQLVFGDRSDASQTLLLQSAADLRRLEEQMEQILPNEPITVSDINGRIALTGAVSDISAAETAERIASAYGDVENFLTTSGGQQVALRIRFAEVSRTAGKEFGVNFGFEDGGNSIIGSNVGQISPLGFASAVGGSVTGLGVSNPSTGTQLFGRGSINGDPFAYYINALRESNLLRVLADPELTVISGEEGEFLAGGEFPVPVPQEEGIAIEYREFGIKLKYKPVVLGDGLIRMELSTEVSDLDETVAVASGGVQVPGLRKRTTSTTIELREGQTLAISGLLRSRTVASKRAVPLLGDVPVLGALFRSVRYRREETELVVLVTPRLIAALNPNEVPPVPGETWHHPNDVELMIGGQLGGDAGVDKPDDADVGGRDDQARGPADRRGRKSPQLESRYAFTPADPIE